MRIYAEKEAEEFLEKQGFPVSSRLITNDEQRIHAYCRKIGFPVALKVVSSKIIHKSDVHGVKLDLRTPEEVSAAVRSIKKIKYAEAVMVEKYSQGHHLLLGLKNDASFGHAITIGWGGIYTETIKDAVTRICPIDEKEAAAMLKELKLYPLLLGARGEKPIQFKKLQKVIAQLSQLPRKYPSIEELDINPILVNHQETRIIDARIVFSEAPVKHRS